MAKLVKLQITGIRSFGPGEEHVQQVTFLSPLTLILGHNGCGKTTIIESIKYACSGELPAGSNNGQGFINDPKITRSASVMAQVKLRIQDPRGNEVTISRVSTVTQVGTTLKFSSKPAAIRVVSPDGEDRSAAGRCIDVTAEVCQIMNVSPAILNNVIFCHQENSAWPLDEGKKLKEKFDEIFDAHKYNKCTDVLRKQLKGKQMNLKLLKMDLENKRDKKVFVERQKRIVEEKERRLERFEEDVAAKNEELEPVKERLEEIFELERVLGDLQNQLTTKEATKKGVVEQQNTIKRSMAYEFEGGDDELEDKIKTFQEDRGKDENFIQELEKRKVDIDNRAKVVAKAVQESQTLLGRLKGDKVQHEKKLVERKNLIERANEKMDVRINGDFLVNEVAQGALEELKGAVENAEIGLRYLIEEKDAEVANLQKVVDQARENTVRSSHNIKSTLKQIQETENKIKGINNELNSISSSDEYLKAYSDKINNIDKTLNNLNSQFKETEESQKIDSYRRSIKDLERDLETLEGEYKILRQNDIVEGKLDSEKRIIMEKQREVNRIKLKHSDALRQLFGETLPEKNLKDSVLSLQTQAELSVKNLTEKINKKQKDITTLEVRRQHQLDKISTNEKELKTKQMKISQICSGKDFNETLDTSFQKKEKLQRDKGQYNSIKVIFGQYIKEFEKESPCCPICETDFRQKKDLVKKIITTLKNKLESVPQKLLSIEDELKKEENRYDQLQQLKLVNNDIETLNYDTIPLLKSQLEDIDKSLKKDKVELENLKSQLQKPQKIVEISKSLISDVSFLDHNQSDVDKAKRTVETLKGELVEVASKKSKQEVEAQIDYLRSEVNESRGKIDAQVKKINNHRDRIQELTKEKMVLVDKHVKLKESSQSRPHLETQKKELEEKLTILRDELDELQATSNLLGAELDSAIKNKDEAVILNKQLVQEERDKTKEYGKIVENIEKLQNEINSYLNEDVESKLKLTEEKLKDYRIKEETLEETKTKIITMISDKKESLAKQENEFQTLKSNVILREKKQLEKSLEIEIQALKKRIGGYNYKTVYEEKRRLINQRENLETQVNKLIGEKTGLIQSLDEIRRELSLPANKKALSNYMSKFYQVKIAEAVINDLLKFIVALENAVLDFHKTKMTEINKYIRELWRNIYRGNDVDYIEIKTDHSGGNARRRSYSYKVVQVKKGIEMDMRGRCSAGQRVLACLVIRMALAESLSASCGILALDEPTTNLDRDNIESLSDALARIVSLRQSEKSFQLLVITHDAEFLSTLTRVQSVPYFFKVDRDNDGFSKITKETDL